MEALQAEVTRAQEEVTRERARREDGAEALQRDNRRLGAEANVLRGQLEEARASGAAAAARADGLSQQLAAAEARLRVLEQQAEQREQVGSVGGRVVAVTGALAQAVQRS